MIPQCVELCSAMPVLGRIGAILFASFCCVAHPVMAVVPAQQCDPLVSVAELIANPTVHDGKVVWVVAHVSLRFEHLGACPSEDHRDVQRCLWLDIGPGRQDPQIDFTDYDARFPVWTRFNGRMVALRATFDRYEGGHFGRWPGGLRNVVEVSGRHGGWSFSADATVPRNSCAGELPPRTVNEKLLDGDFDEAIADLSRAIERDPGNRELRMHRASARRQKGDNAGAIAEYTQLMEDWEESDKSVLFIVRGWAREAAGDLDGAIADYSRAIELDPEVSVYRDLDRARQKKVDGKGAAADFAPEIQPKWGH